MTKRLFSSFIGMMICLITWGITTPEDGKYYRIVNQNPDKSITTEGVKHGYVVEENTTSHVLNAVEPGSDTKYAQIWLYTSKKFKNAHTSRYITTLSRSVQGVTAVSGVAPTLTDKGTYFLITYGQQMHADGSNKIVGWTDEGNKSNYWDFEEVEVDEEALKVVQEKYAKEQAEKSALEAVAAKASTYAPIVAGYFKDDACTELNDACAAKTDEQMTEMMTADGLPEQVQTMVLNIKNKWAGEYNPEMSAKFRVQDYKIYSKASYKNDWVATQMSDMNNPTGIWTNSLELMYVFVDGDIPEGTSLRIVGAVGAEVTRVWCDNGTALKKGMNILYCGDDCAYQWIMYTANTTDYKKKLSDYPDIKIHIEGGKVLGYVDAAGKTEDVVNADYEATLKHANGILKANNESPRNINFAVKGERGLFLWPVEVYNQIWADQAWWGKKYGYKIYKSLYFYDSVLKWEWSVMGFQDRVEAGEADNDHENLAAGYGDAKWPTYVNCLAPTMMYYSGKNPYSSDGYTCMPSIGAVESSYNAERGDFDTWCVGHESGHNNQHTVNLPSSMESSNNMFSNIITYLWGYKMSRGMTFNENMDYVKSKTIFSNRSISMTLRMYWNLYQYYHRVGNQKGFMPALHKALRSDRMSFGGEGWWEGPSGGANMGVATNSWLKFYEKACDAAKEDLTEYFRMWGFFIPTNECEGSVYNSSNGKYYTYCGDYSSYYIECTQKMINDAINRVKKKGYPENKQICFIEDRLQLQKRTDIWAGKDDGYTYKPTENEGYIGSTEELKAKYGDIGYVDYYKQGQMKMAKAEDYTYLATAGKIKIKVKEGAEENGVGIIVYAEDGSIAWMSNRFEFSVPAEVSASNFTVKIINADGSEVEIMNAIDSDDPAILKEALTAAIDASKDLTNLVDDKTVGFYTTSSISTLQGIVEKANEAIANGEDSKYKELAKEINNEIVNVSLNAEKNKLKTNVAYTLRNYQFKHQGGSSYLSGTNASAVSDGTSENSQWVFVPTTGGKYLIQCRGTQKLISVCGDNGSFKTEASTADAAYQFELIEAGNGSYYLRFYNGSKYVNINETPSWNGIISWGEGEGSQWYISEVEEIDGVTGEEVIALINDTKALMDKAGKIETSVQKLPLQGTDKNAAYYIKTNRESTDHPFANIIDGDRSTYFLSKSGGTAYHNFTIDLGEGNEANYLRLTCTTTTEQDGTSPKTIVAMPSTGMTSGFASAEKSEFTNLADGSNKTYYNDTKEAAKPYRYWRFQVTETQNQSTGYPQFSLAEIQVRTLVATVTLNEEYGTLDTKVLKNANSSCKKAESALAALNTLLSNKATYDELKAVYDALLAAMEAASPTVIEGVNADTKGNAAIYDLSGRRVSKMDKAGIYIVNGKKVAVK